MTITLTVQLKDIAMMYAFTNSRSAHYKREYNNTRQLNIIWVVLISLLIFVKFNPVAGVVLLLIGVVYLLFWPGLEKQRIQKQMMALAQHYHGKREGRQVQISFDEDFIVLQEESNRSQLALSEIQQILEIPTHFIIVVLGGYNYIFPKDQLEDEAALREHLKTLAESLQFPYELDETWKMPS